ncbi:defensin beta 136 [Erinaceus europaeus]|uniref:Defensin beta 136 n=1 Tax=Erinaceus europaeus TaxID=9365 RepID=A0A1S3W3M9_ERIEU|nr:defensin beta 136 [Erinaceus europaeus]
MRFCLSGLLFLLMTSLPSGDGAIGNEGVKVRTCTAVGGRCYFGCKPGWEWVSFCYTILSCCKVTKNKPPQFYDLTR